LTGFTDNINIPENPSFVDALAWTQMYKNIYGLGNLKNFEGFRE